MPATNAAHFRGHGPLLQMKRRTFLGSLGALGLTSCQRWLWPHPSVSIHRPGMDAGHGLRDHRALPDATETLRCDALIVGSGAAGLSAAYKLAREGWTNLLLVEGPEPGGNTAGEVLGGVACPTGAHYLPLVSQESTHVREMLADLGIIRSGTFSATPEYDERVLVHPQQERLRVGKQWHEDLLPAGIMDDSERMRFLGLITTLRDTKGTDGKRIFTIPVELASQDPQWRVLDTLSFHDWLMRENFRDTQLHWYANYACRDDYGCDYRHTSAWAGLHYFASRNGQAANAEAGSVLTWPDGLNGLMQVLRTRLLAHAPQAILPGFAAQVRETRSGVEALIVQMRDGAPRALRVEARRAICAMPLHVAQHVVAGINDYGFRREELPAHAPWLVANFLLRRFPAEEGNLPLAWDNVVRTESKDGLGYVVATHQLIRVAKPEHTVFTAYRALSSQTPEAARNWMLTASDQDLLDLAASDLLAVYGQALWPLVEQVSIHLRGHAMASPTPGFLSNRSLQSLRTHDGRILFAHSNLSGYSVFEEAAWWGYRRAGDLLGH